jgi:ketosteroid isomerase-like protein
MNSKTKRASLILLLALVTLLLVNFFGSCSEPQKTKKEDIETAMRSLMQTYADAINEINPEKAISHYNQSPDFIVYQDGISYDYEKTVEQVKTFFPSVKFLHVKWDTIIVRVLNGNVVSAFAPFHESFTDKNDVETRLVGEVTWIARKDADKWEFVYGHAFHKPDTAK